jgi:hypothetical protein
MSREELELDLEYTGARRSLFVVLCLVIAGMLFGFFDFQPAGALAADLDGVNLGHSVLGLLFVFLAAYVGLPQPSNPKP